MHENLAGTQPQEVLQLLQSRARAMSCGVPSTDGRKLGLVIEGGGMRGVLSAGSLFALDLMGFRHCFDAVYGVSAGSVNAAYFLSGQGLSGITVYFDDISSRRFINPWRFWKMVDVDYVYDYIVPCVKPLDETAIRACRSTFQVTATDVHTGENVLLDAKDPHAPVRLYLKASSALPVLYNHTVAIGGHRYVDGGASAGLPITAAIASGCTDIVVLVSRPPTYIASTPGLLERGIFKALAGFRYPNLYRAWMQMSSVKEDTRELALGTERVLGVRIATIFPNALDGGVHRTTISRERLLQGAYLSARSTMDLFEYPPESLEAIFAALR